MVGVGSVTFRGMAGPPSLIAPSDVQRVTWRGSQEGGSGARKACPFIFLRAGQGHPGGAARQVGGESGKEQKGGSQPGAGGGHGGLWAGLSSANPVQA